MNQNQRNNATEPRSVVQRQACSGDWKAGWCAAMKAVHDRLPMPGYEQDPMTPREVEKLLNFVKANLPNALDQTPPPTA
jgi:hypothetical protein